MDSGAVIDSTGTYRYSLYRKWAEGQWMTFIMLNPSTADAAKDDPTIRRCIGFAQAWGYAGVQVVNLFAYRATKPNELLLCVDPVGPDNVKHMAMAMGAALVVAAWGNSPVAMHVSIRSALSGITLNCLGVTKSGNPRHPLYVRGDMSLQPYEVR